ncbi:hypothetical protein E2C01_035786 [Portunus trituberculatus]|uniref:Uncharacterized protein n=1 Tax=Portunus trituberculatus TaxID=210409 RepID=A0A5B7F6V1_PORTR|nr:hypothetical protein [Portunus trituberculatus]
MQIPVSSRCFGDCQFSMRRGSTNQHSVCEVLEHKNTDRMLMSTIKSVMAVTRANEARKEGSKISKQDSTPKRETNLKQEHNEAASLVVGATISLPGRNSSPSFLPTPPHRILGYSRVFPINPLQQAQGITEYLDYGYQHTFLLLLLLLFHAFLLLFMFHLFHTLIYYSYSPSPPSILLRHPSVDNDGYSLKRSYKRSSIFFHYSADHILEYRARHEVETDQCFTQNVERTRKIHQAIPNLFQECTR